MSTPWIVAFAVLTVCVALMGLVLVGTLRRIAGVLEQTEARLLEAGIGGPGPGGLEPGSRLPAFSVRRFRGGWLSDDDLRGLPAVILLISSTCPACGGLVRELRRSVGTLPIPVYVVAENDDEVEALELAQVPNVLIQPKRELSIALKTSTTPHAFAIDRSGTIAATSTPNTLHQLRELVEPALDGGGDAAVLEQVPMIPTQRR
ncbi:MAG: hypothetical protein H0W90_16480 [Actinobacteria bacterium]|nr:hypothetical protein [Actinomycetota bacterium]